MPDILIFLLTRLFVLPLCHSLFILVLSDDADTNKQNFVMHEDGTIFRMPGTPASASIITVLIWKKNLIAFGELCQKKNFLKI